ncbi:MAG: hypothetical protein JWP88_1582, partial [Flaviaesturariibacter sp.]|nr:hypothetical protein [Flaviaesturariibacter sp.]
YYWRRLIRLEPPYLLILTLLFLAHIFLVQKFTFRELWPHYIASFFYQHNLVYHEFSWVMPVAWTLEIEVQFYILAPLFCCIFLIHARSIRLFMYGIIILLDFYLCNLHVLGYRNIFSNLYFFWGGILLADLYVDNRRLIKNENAGLAIGMAALIGFLFMTPQYTGLPFLLKYLFLLLVFHITLTNKFFKSFFSGKMITIIGGMCYSLYLTHFAVISAVGGVIKKSGIDYQKPLYLVPIYLLFICLILVVTAVFFISVEKPFMRYRLKK